MQIRQKCFLSYPGTSALSVAAAHAHEALVRELLKRGAALESVNAYGWTALMQAARNGHVHVVNTLVNNKADVRVSSHVGTSALHCAVCSADVSTGKYIRFRELNIS